ncbi:MAG: AMP-binding protein, partial [Parvularculaceae bacterium]|nr:AMP-binding protein [Parvularculaceae bacterium]
MANDRPWRRFYPSQAKALDDQGFGLIKSADELIRESADAFGDKPAVTTALPNGWSASLSYREVDQYSQAFANYLRSIGLKSGEVVGLQSLNCAGFAIAILGILRANLAVTNINPLYTPYEMRHQLRDSGAKALVYMDLLGKTVEDAVTDQPDLHLVSMSLSDFFAPVRRTVLDVSLKRLAKKVPQTALNPV